MSGEVGDARKRNAEPVPTDDVEALGRLLFDIDGWHESHWGDEGDKFRAQARKLLASDWLTAHDAQVRRDATREALTHAKDDIKARIVTFRELNADHQYMNALNDAWGLVANRLRADTAPEPSEHSEPESAQYRELAGQAHTAARAVPTERAACPSGCGRNEPCPDLWHDRRPAPTPPTLGHSETGSDHVVASPIETRTVGDDEAQHCPTCTCGCTCGYGGIHEPGNAACDLNAALARAAAGEGR